MANSYQQAESLEQEHVALTLPHVEFSQCYSTPMQESAEDIREDQSAQQQRQMEDMNTRNYAGGRNGDTSVKHSAGDRGLTSERSTKSPDVENLDVFKKPHLLIDTSSPNDFKVNKPILDQIRMLNKSLVVVGVVGPYRSGKSYMLNRLAKSEVGEENFETGGTVEAKTKGIWVWLRKHPKSDKKYIVLLDTEGIGDAKRANKDHDNKIFCLATLLSSVLVFNIKNAIDDTSLEYISFISEMSRRLSTQSKPGEESEYDEIFPRLVYAIRDFSLDLEIDGEEISADDYLENTLKIVPSSDAQLKEYNNTRRYIRRYFKYRACRTFDRPVNDRKKFKTLYLLEDEILNSTFLEEFDDFYEYVIIKGPEKMQTTGGCKGEMFADMVEEFSCKIHSGIPSVENTMKTVSRNENSRIADEGVKIYNDNMTNAFTLPTTDSEILIAHDKCIRAALDYYVPKSVFDNENTYQIRMNERIQECLQEFLEENSRSSKKSCLSYLEKLYEEIAKKRQDGCYSKQGGHLEYTQDFHQLEAEYRKKQGLGGQKDSVWVEFRASKRMEEESIINSDKTMTEGEKQKKSQEIDELAKQFEEKLKTALKENEDTIRKQIEEERKKAEEINIQKMEQKRQEDIQKLKNHYEDIIKAKEEEAKRLKKEGLVEESEAVESEIPQIQSKKDETENSYCIIL